MMKLEFDQVLDYVRDGETDPFTKEMLERDPDGAQMLREARQMRDAFRDSSESGENSVDVGEAAFAEPPMLSLGTVREQSAAGSLDEFIEDEGHEVSRKQMFSLEKLVSRATTPIRSLGELRIVHRDERIDLSHIPVAARPTLGRKLNVKDKDTKYQSVTAGLSGGRRTIAGVVVRGVGMRLAFPDTVAPGSSLNIRISNTRLQIPERSLEITFMPEKGTFSRSITDTKGIAELPMPEASGTLRIETSPPTVLNVEVKK